LFHRIRWPSLELCTDCTSQYPTPKVQTLKSGNLVGSVQLTNQGPEFYKPASKSKLKKSKRSIEVRGV
jgi:hypothetical protein